MKYKITITKIEERTVTKRGEFTLVNERPWTEEELNKEMASHYGDRQEFLKDNPLKKIRDYAPSWQGIEQVETEVLKQTVETLDLAAVIKAVNGI